MKDYLERFDKWMITKGRMSKKLGIPSNPLSRKFAGTVFLLVRRVLIDLGYVEKISNGDNRVGHISNEYLVYSPEHKDLKRIKDLSINELESYFDNDPKFKDVADRKVRSSKRMYVNAIWKFGEYLHYELGYWKKSKLVKLKTKVYPPSIKYKELQIIEPDRVDKFLEFLKDHNFKLYGMIFVSRWLGGMRYSEIINIKKDFKSGSLIINNIERDQYAKVWGKGEAGLGKPRMATLLGSVKKVLLDTIEFNKESEWLFVTKYGEKYNSQSANINKSLRLLAKKSGLFNDSEIDKIRFHALGRHTFGTYYYDKIPPKLLKEEMGISDNATLEKYANITLDQRNKLVTKASNGNGFENVPEPQDDKLSMLREALSSLSKEEKLELLSELI